MPSPAIDVDIDNSEAPASGDETGDIAAVDAVDAVDAVVAGDCVVDVVDDDEAGVCGRELVCECACA